MIETLQFMFRNASVKNATIYIIGAILGIVLSDIVIDGWQGIAALSRDFVIVLPISIGIILIVYYANAKGKVEGILDGTTKERKKWINWYKRHKEELKEQGIEFEAPDSSMLQCPRCGGHHD